MTMSNLYSQKNDSLMPTQSKESVPFTIPSLVLCGWGPSELWRFSVGASVLNRSLLLVHVPTNMLTRLKLSFVQEPFDILHSFTSPNREVEIESIYDDVSVSVVVDSELTDVEPKGETGAFKLSFNVSNHRQYTVSRSRKEVFQIIKITSHVFPELAIPSIDSESEVDIVITDVFCQCVATNAQLLGSFIPILFFFLERNSASVSAFLQATISTVASERKALTPPQQKSGWFSSWKKKASMGEEDALEADEKFLLEESIADASVRETSARIASPVSPSVFSLASGVPVSENQQVETTWSMFQRAKVAYLDSMQVQVGIQRVTQALANTEIAYNELVDFMQDDYFVEDVFVSLPGWLRERSDSQTVSRESSLTSSVSSSAKGISNADDDTPSRAHSQHRTSVDWSATISQHQVDGDFIVPHQLPAAIVNDLSPALHCIQSLRPANVSYFLEMLSCPPRYAVLYNQAIVDLMRRIPQLSRSMVRLPPEGARQLAGQVACIKQHCTHQVMFAREKERQAYLQLCVLITCLTRMVAEQ